MLQWGSRWVSPWLPMSPVDFKKGPCHLSLSFYFSCHLSLCPMSSFNLKKMPCHPVDVTIIKTCVFKIMLRPHPPYIGLSTYRGSTPTVAVGVSTCGPLMGYVIIATCIYAHGSSVQRTFSRLAYIVDDIRVVILYHMGLLHNNAIYTTLASLLD